VWRVGPRSQLWLDNARARCTLSSRGRVPGSMVPGLGSTFHLWLELALMWLPAAAGPCLSAAASSFVPAVGNGLASSPRAAKRGGAPLADDR
jgi:hypothetical protein